MTIVEATAGEASRRRVDVASTFSVECHIRLVASVAVHD